MADRPIIMRDPIPAENAQKIWRVLVEECGCRDAPDNRDSFVRYLAADNGFGHEWRFQGKLGFGGKFYNDHFAWRVGCYSEHRTPERDEMIRRADERLTELRAEYARGRDGSGNAG